MLDPSIKDVLAIGCMVIAQCSLFNMSGSVFERKKNPSMPPVFFGLCDRIEQRLLQRLNVRSFHGIAVP